MVQIGRTLTLVFAVSLWILVGGIFGVNYWLKFEHYFDVGAVVVPDVVASEGFEFDTSARALRGFNGSYKVILRDFRTKQAKREYPDSGVFEYIPTFNEKGEPISGYPSPVSFDWWVGEVGHLEALPTGLFYMQTCWTAHDRLQGLLPAVSGCVDSNPFRVE